MSNYNLPPSLPAPPRFDAFSDRPHPNSYGNNNNNNGYGNGNSSYDRNLPSSLPLPPPPSIRMNNNNNNGPPPPPGQPLARGGGRANYDSDNHQRDRSRRDDRGGGGGRDRGPSQRMGRSPDGRGRRRNAEKDSRSVEERVNQERRCRTLFVRNVAYEANAVKLQDAFAQYGEIKTFYEKIKDRGIVFVTYYDLRAPPVARDAMHNTLVEGRPIDVHYSLPKEDDMHGPCDRDKNQGSIMLYVKPPRVLTELEVGKMAEGFGVVKSVKPGREPAEKIIDYFDSRAAVLLHDRMQNKPFAGGTLDLRFIWDEIDDLVPPVPPVGSTIHRSHPPPPPPPTIQPRRSGEGPGYGEVRGHAHGRDRDRSPDRRGSYTGPNSGPGGPPNRYGDAPPAAPPDDRLEQARKVQQLLASLGGAPAPAPAPAPTNQGYPPSTPNNGYGPPPPAVGRQDYSSAPYQNNQYQPRPAPAQPSALPASSQYPSPYPPSTSYAPPPSNYPPYPPSNNQNQYQPAPPAQGQGQVYPPAPANVRGPGGYGYSSAPAAAPPPPSQTSNAASYSQNRYNPNQPPNPSVGAYQPPQQSYGQQQQQQQNQAQDVNSLLAMLSNSGR